MTSFLGNIPSLCKRHIHVGHNDSGNIWISHVSQKLSPESGMISFPLPDVMQIPTGFHQVDVHLATGLHQLFPDDLVQPARQPCRALQQDDCLKTGFPSWPCIPPSTESDGFYIGQQSACIVRAYPCPSGCPRHNTGTSRDLWSYDSRNPFRPPLPAHRVSSPAY